MRLSLESRHGALERLGRDDIDNKIAEIDAERQIYTFSSLSKKDGSASNSITDPGNDGVTKDSSSGAPHINSGMLNGQNPKEQERIEKTGKNGTPKNERGGTM